MRLMLILSAALVFGCAGGFNPYPHIAFGDSENLRCKEIQRQVNTDGSYTELGTDCTMATGGQLSETGGRVVGQGLGMARNAAAAFLGIPVPPAGGAQQPVVVLQQPAPTPSE